MMENGNTRVLPLGNFVDKRMFLCNHLEMAVAIFILFYISEAGI
jgi:hypothetical protein